jgi:heptosyltransferase-2
MARRPLDLPEGARVLVRLPNWIGDVILCTPALAALRRVRPDLRLEALVKPKVRAAVEGLPSLDAVRFLAGEGLGDTLRQARELRGEGFAAALIFPKGAREALLAFAARIPVRVGLATDRRSLLLTHPVPFGEEEWNRHHALQFASILSPLGISLRGEGLAFPIGERERAEAGRILAEAGLAEGPLALFHVSASKDPRAWHAERFGLVARELSERTGCRVALVGTEAERPLHARVRSACPSAVDLAGATSLSVLAAVMERARLLVCNDSGPMHLGAAAGTRVVAIFGPGAPHKTAPFVPPERVRVVYAALPCSPCRQAFWKECSPSPAGKPPCLEGVHTGAVLKACLELWEGTPDARR